MNEPDPAPIELSSHETCISKSRRCCERASVARELADSAPTLAEREAGRAAEQQWLRFARLYELMDEVFASLGSKELERQEHEEDSRLAPL